MGSEFKARGGAEALRANAKDRGPCAQRRSHLQQAGVGVPAGAGAAPGGAEGQLGEVEALGQVRGVQIVRGQLRTSFGVQASEREGGFSRGQHAGCRRARRPRPGRRVCNKQHFVLDSGSFGQRDSLASHWLRRRETSAFGLHGRASVWSQNFGMW